MLFETQQSLSSGGSRQRAFIVMDASQEAMQQMAKGQEASTASLN